MESGRLSTQQMSLKHDRATIEERNYRIWTSQSLEWKHSEFGQAFRSSWIATMKDIDKTIASLDGRIRQLTNEVAALEALKTGMEEEEQARNSRT
jgi:hypothetical protein